MSSVEALAGKIQFIMGFVDSIDEDELELLNQTLDKTRERISHNEAALPIIYAMGGQYDSKEDRIKEDEIKVIIQLVQLRQKYRMFAEEQQHAKARNRNVLKLFGL